MTEILNWHPKFNVYPLENKDLLLITEQGAFCLSNQHFPLFDQVNGVRSQSDIVSDQNLTFDQETRFYYQVGALKKEGILVESSEPISSFINRYQPVTATQHQISHFTVTSLLPEHVQGLALWLQAFQTLSAQGYTGKGVQFFLVESLLDLELDTLDILSDRVCLIKAVGEKFWISPVVTASKAQGYFQSLQHRLLWNNSAYALVKKAFPDDDRCLPYDASLQLSGAHVDDLVKLMAHQLSAQSDELFLMDSTSGQTEVHPVEVHHEPDHFAQQVTKPVILQDCEVHFNKDGGSRSISPEQTVMNLQRFISHITGVITHIRPLPGSQADSAQGAVPSSGDSINIYVTSFFKSPAVKDLEKINNESFVQNCMGKGVCHVQSQASALCETVERFSAQYQGCEPLLLSTPDDLTKRYYDFQQLVPYTEAQYRNFTDANHPDSKLKQAAKPYNGEAVHWLPTWSLSHDEPVYVPLTSCFANMPFDDDAFARWHSNGAAAGNTLEEAILQALFELIERDATAIWWYNRVERPGFDLECLDPDYLAPINKTLSVDHDYWLLDLSHDIGVPVIAAVGKNKQTGGISFGFGCHLQKELAAQRALTELCQLLPIRNQNGAPFEFDAIEVGDYLFPTEGAQCPDNLLQASGNIKQDVELIVQRLKSLNFETLVLNYSREPLPVKTAKVFVPGLCHIWPQLANERLYHAPVQLGWLAQANNEQTIHAQALYI
ncbi:MAG: bacteriocin biosynthesis protein [Oceanospirillum sp.]|nr:bacteriocin biosynthesis protein [Oceanospirillum sp.]